MVMNRNKVNKRLNKSEGTKISEVQASLRIIKNSHASNELIVNKLKAAAQNEHQVELCSALQTDMTRINHQLNTIVENLKTVDSME